jgi:hypothetical protein
MYLYLYLLKFGRICFYIALCNILAIFWALAIAMIFSNKKAALSAAFLLTAQKRLFTYNL